MWCWMVEVKEDISYPALSRPDVRPRGVRWRWRGEWGLHVGSPRGQGDWEGGMLGTECAEPLDSHVEESDSQMSCSDPILLVHAALQVRPGYLMCPTRNHSTCCSPSGVGGMVLLPWTPTDARES